LNNLVFLDSIAYFIDKASDLQTILLALKELQDKHSNTNIIVIILNVLSIYAIRNKLKYFVINNVINNNTMLKTIAKKFQETNNVYYNSIKHCLCCINYVINLFV